MERLTELEMNSIGFAILCNFPRFCGEERTKEASDMFRAMKAEIMAYRALGPVEGLSALVKAREEGRAILPMVSERDKKGMADFLHDCFADWTHDPSVGLYGMTEGEAILANAIMDALTRAEAEAAQREEGQDG